MNQKIKLFKKEKGYVRKVTNSFSVLNLLTGKDSDKVSVAVGTAKDHFETTKPSGDRVYFILEGKIIVNGDIIGKAGDVIFAPAKTKYRFKGTFRAVIINSPPFKKKEENIS